MKASAPSVGPWFVNRLAQGSDAPSCFGLGIGSFVGAFLMGVVSPVGMEALVVSGIGFIVTAAFKTPLDGQLPDIPGARNSTWQR